MGTLTNKPYAELSLGDEATLDRVCTEDDFLIFANASGNHNPVHLAGLGDGGGAGGGEGPITAPSLWVGSLVSAVLGNMLPGPGTRYRAQTFAFHAYAKAGDELTIRVKVTEKRADNEVLLDTEVTRKPDGARILTGEALVVAPHEKLVFDDVAVPGLVVSRHRHFQAIIARARPLPPIPTAVVAPEEANSLGGALLARDNTIIDPVLVGAPDAIHRAAEAMGVSLDSVEIVPAASHAQAAETAVALVRSGRCRALMKGHLHTDVLLRACLAKDGGLRTGRRLTHVFVMDVPGSDHPVLVTDAAINIAPDLKTKVDIVQNAIDVAISIGVEEPRVGVLSAVETVNPDIPSSIDAALLSKMSERGQIAGGLVDGPLAMDNAVDIQAARTKGIRSQVAGRADILVVPNLDAGNMLAKQMIYAARGEGAGLVLGAAVPIVLNSRSDDDMARLASCAVAALHAARTNGTTG